MGHDYVFSMAVITIGEWLKLVPFLLGDEQLILRGGGGLSFKKKINTVAVKHLKMVILAWVSRKIKKIILHPSDSNRLYLKINGLC